MAAKGCSGGPWLDNSGHVVGMQAANITIREIHQGIASAVPATKLAKLVDGKADIEISTLQMAVEGIWEQAPEFIKNLPEKTRGLVARQVIKNGLASNAGISEMDIILSAEGKTFEESANFIRFLRGWPQGNPMELTILEKSNGKKKQIKLLPVPLR